MRFWDFNFVSLSVFINFLQDNSFLGVAAIGMTFVILSGGIDLSVGAIIALTSVLLAHSITAWHLHPAVAMFAVVAAGTMFGASQGALISLFQLPPFLVTLAGMFLARGLALVISLESVAIRHDFFERLNELSVRFFPVTAMIFIIVAAFGMYLAHHTSFGRNVYAVGGRECAALLMGLPIRRTKMAVYALSGSCASIGGVLFALYTSSGNANAATMLELDAIAAVVIGGTLLSGGIGGVFGTCVGVLILAIIRTAIDFEGTLSSWWAKIATGILVLAFILLQTGFQHRDEHE
jgi:simple sugar transport system permease protein